MRIEDVKVGMKVVLGPQTTVKHLPEIFRGVYSRGQMYVYVVSVDDQCCHLATHLNGGGIGTPMHPGWLGPYTQIQATKVGPTQAEIEEASLADYRKQKKYDDGFDRRKGFMAGVKWYQENYGKQGGQECQS